MKLFQRLLRRKQPRPQQSLLVAEIVRNLIDGCDLLIDLGVRAWLTDGTLLGYYREQRILQHDQDADLGLFIEDYSDRILAGFKNAGWELDHVFGNIECGLQLSFLRNGSKLDLFFFYPEGDRLWHGAWKAEPKGKFRKLIKYYYEPFELRMVDFLGRQFAVPADTEQYLVTKYGEGWAVEQREWDWAFGPSNAIATEIRLPRNKKKKVS
ncbi:MAG: LicD family protein [Candidatus Delongbacteria bacterium]|nr:LicD family protein [Candidatus Delongbacteria bacterium]